MTSILLFLLIVAGLGSMFSIGFRTGYDRALDDMEAELDKMIAEEEGKLNEQRLDR